MNFSKLILLIVGFGVPMMAQATMIPIDDRTEVALGDGVDPVTGQRFNPCIKYDPNNVEPEDFKDEKNKEEEEKKRSSARKMKVEVQQVTSYRDFDRYTNTSVSGSFNYYGSGGSFSVDQESRNTMFSDQASLGISDEADYGRWYLSGVELLPEMAELAKRDPDQFYKMCGREYIAGYIRGQGIRILMSTEKNSVYSYERIQASLHAAYNGAVTKGSLDASFTNIASELIKNGMLRINYFSFGSGDLSSANELIRNQDDINAYREKIADIVQKMKGDQAVKTVYITRTYPKLQGSYDPIFAAHQKQTFDLLYSDYRRLFDTRKRLASIMGPDFSNFADRQCVADYKKYCVDYVDRLEESRQQVEDAIGLIDRLAMQCAHAKTKEDCVLPSLRQINLDVLTQIQWPMQFRYAMYLQMLEDIKNRKVK